MTQWNAETICDGVVFLAALVIFIIAIVSGDTDDTFGGYN